MITLFASAWAGSLGTASVDGLDEAYAPRRVAVLVGVDEYRDADLPSLRYAAKDADELADVLEEHGNFDRVLVLTAGEDTSGEAIEKAVDLAAADLQRDDTFLLYLSGHGTLTLDAQEGTRLWFLPSDSTLDTVRETGLAVESIEERVASVPARRRVLVMDTCHNGREKSLLDPTTARLLEGMRGDPPAPRVTRDVSESEARLFAAQYYQPALEDPALENGVYTHFLIEALSEASRDADLSGDGLVDVAEAHDWARDKTIAHTGGLQIPRAEYRIVGREEIYLAGDESLRGQAERALLAATDGLLASAQVLVDGIPRGVLPDVVAIEPGVHRLELQDDAGRTLLKRSLRVQSGETVMVEDLVARRGPGVEVSAGGVVRVGDMATVQHPYAGELEVTWLEPWRAARWMSTDLHVRGNAMRGAVEDQDVGTSVDSGVVAAGTTVSFAPEAWPLSVGPGVELALPWRSFEDREGLHRQAALSLVPSARVALRPSIGNRHLALRYDARLASLSYAGAWTPGLEQAVSIGLGTRKR